TLSITGWRIGYVVTPPTLTSAVRKVHDFLTVGAARPLQVAVAHTLDGLPDTYYRELAQTFQRKRDRFVAALRDAGFDCLTPEGAYYVMAEWKGARCGSDYEAALELIRRAG